MDFDKVQSGSQLAGASLIEFVYDNTITLSGSVADNTEIYRDLAVPGDTPLFYNANYHMLENGITFICPVKPSTQQSRIVALDEAFSPVPKVYYYIARTSDTNIRYGIRVETGGPTRLLVNQYVCNFWLWIFAAHWV